MAACLTFTCDRCSLQDITDPVGTHSLPLRTDLVLPEGWDQTGDELLCRKCLDTYGLVCDTSAPQSDGDAS